MLQLKQEENGKSRRKGFIVGRSKIRNRCPDWRAIFEPAWL